MSFYIWPHSNVVKLQWLEKNCLKRLKFLAKLLSLGDFEGTNSGTWIMKAQDLLSHESTAELSDCLIEGSKKDIISHFVLRLLCASEKDLTDLFIEGEKRLFILRLRNFNKEELFTLCDASLRELCGLSSLRNTSHISDTIRMVFDADSKKRSLPNGEEWKSLQLVYQWKDIVTAYMRQSAHTCFTLPFHLVPALVAERQAKLYRGFLFVPCRVLDVALSSIFKQLLSAEMSRIKSYAICTLKEDQRMKDLSVDVWAWLKLFAKGINLETRPIQHLIEIHHNEIDFLLLAFPPCMSHLHQQLRTKHRLGHHARIQYTLFLKEIGLSCEQALHFWQSEYSRPELTDLACSHSWKPDKVRYTYNIKHLYGLEGSRTNYRAHCCSAIQDEILSCGDEGGCPFVHFDISYLCSLFCELKELKRQRIIDLVAADLPLSACQLLFQYKLKRLVMSIKQKINARISENTLCDSDSDIVKFLRYVTKMVSQTEVLGDRVTYKSPARNLMKRSGDSSDESHVCKKVFCERQKQGQKTEDSTVKDIEDISFWTCPDHDCCVMRKDQLSASMNGAEMVQTFFFKKPSQYYFQLITELKSFPFNC